MADLIDRQALFPNGVFLVNKNNLLGGLDELINRIWNAPTIDAVEVVRCKDCTRCRIDTASGEERYYCRAVEGLHRKVQPYEFCSCAERIGENE